MPEKDRQPDHDLAEVHLGRRTNVKAIASAEPPPRKKFQRDPAALNGLHAHIDAMLEADPGTRVSTIWQHLADDHGATVTGPTLGPTSSNGKLSCCHHLVPRQAMPALSCST